MPDAKDNQKLTGDVHPPEVATPDGHRPQGNPDVQGAHGTPREGKDRKEVDQAGHLKDKDAALTRDND